MNYCHVKPEKLLALEYTPERLFGQWLGYSWEVIANDEQPDGTAIIQVKVSNEYDWDIATVHRKRQGGSLERIAKLCVASFTLLQIQKKYGYNPLI